MIDDDLYSLCQLLTIPPTECTKAFTRWRFDTLHVRGVEKMDTEDVFNYFNEAPTSITWLSNISCNVSFENMSAAVNSALDLANGLVVPTKEANKLKDESNAGLEIFTADSLEIPVPPNYRYLLGPPHKLAKSIIIRFATIEDVKPPENDPRTTSTDLMVSHPNVDYDYNLPHRTIINSNNSIIQKVLRTRGKPAGRNQMRLRLHADDESEVKHTSVVKKTKVPIHQRLGWNNSKLITNSRVNISRSSNIINRVGKNFHSFKNKKAVRSLKNGDLRNVLNKRKN